MKDNGIQQIAVEARNRKSGPGIFQTIGMILFILPIIAHGFKWGWIYPIIALFALVILPEGLGVLGVIIGILLLVGSIWLCRRRVLAMRRKRKLENMPKLYTPYSMRDDD